MELLAAGVVIVAGADGEGRPGRRVGRELVLSLVGVAALAAGSAAIVEAVVRITDLEATQTRLGLTLVGFATAFELVVLAGSTARRGMPETVVAAVVGSFAYNVTMTLGAAAVPATDESGARRRSSPARPCEPPRRSDDHARPGTGGPAPGRPRDRPARRRPRGAHPVPRLHGGRPDRPHRRPGSRLHGRGAKGRPRPGCGGPVGRRLPARGRLAHPHRPRPGGARRGMA